MRCTIYAQIFGLAQKANVIFESSQWRSNSKEINKNAVAEKEKVQSPQWGSNSKEMDGCGPVEHTRFQSPQWGSNSKEKMEQLKSPKVKVSVPAMGK